MSNGLTARLLEDSSWGSQTAVARPGDTSPRSSGTEEQPVGLRLRVDLLGAVEARLLCGESVSLSPRQLLVLAVLAHQPDRLVSRDSLVDVLWREEPPLSATNAVQVAVSGLRKQLRGVGLDDIVRTKANGYVLSSADIVTDTMLVEVRETVAAEAVTAGRPRAAMESLRGALALWRCEPLAGLDGAFVDRFRAHTYEKWLQIFSSWVDLSIDAGRSTALIGPLQSALQDYPWHQGLYTRLMACLHNVGRSQEALEVFRDLYDVLSRSFGTEPSPMTREVHHAILANHLPITSAQLAVA